MTVSYSLDEWIQIMERNHEDTNRQTCDGSVARTVCYHSYLRKGRTGSRTSGRIPLAINSRYPSPNRSASCDVGSRLRPTHSRHPPEASGGFLSASTKSKKIPEFILEPGWNGSTLDRLVLALAGEGCRSDCLRGVGCFGARRQLLYTRCGPGNSLPSTSAPPPASSKPVAVEGLLLNCDVRSGTWDAHRFLATLLGLVVQSTFPNDQCPPSAGQVRQMQTAACWILGHPL